ncbi:MAG: hypothetical protein AAF604_16105 [Acidobacteriota bacterium]
MSKSSSLRYLSIWMVAGLLLLPVAGAWAQGADESLSKREARRLQRDGAAALEQGDLATAMASFQQLAQALPKGDPRRADALFSLAISSLLQAQGDEAAASDSQRADQALAELEDSFPKFDRRAEVAAVRGALRQGEEARQTARQEAAELRQQIEARAAEAHECAAALAAQEEAGSAESSAAEAEVKALQAEVRKLRSRLASIEEELKKKEEALRKVKETLVGS